jgi:DNA modification methylase
MTPYYTEPGIEIYHGDCIEVMAQMEPKSVHCCITSPPYWGLRDYNSDGQIGLEETPEEYVAKIVEVFRGVRRVLRGDGTLWLNMGDTYATGGKGGGGSFMNERRDGSWKHRSAVCGWRCAPDGLKHKDLVGIPWRVAFALQADGWYLRSDIIWAKPNPMPESVTDRPTKSHEHIFLMSKSAKYFYNNEAIAEDAAGGREKFGGDRHGTKGLDGSRNDANRFDGTIVSTRNKRDVWTVATQPFSEAHFAVFPPALIIPCIDAGCPKGGTVLDPFSGAGTTMLTSKERGRQSVGIDLSSEYIDIAIKRLRQGVLAL